MSRRRRLRRWLWRAPERRVAVGLFVLGAVMATGTLWYWVVEDFGALSAAYQTVTTVFTVGFGEVHPLDTSGQVFTIVLIVVGVGAAVFTGTALFEDVVQEQFLRAGRGRMERAAARLDRHGVICGYGRVGSGVAGMLGDDIDLVVIEEDPDRTEEAAREGYVVLGGDATDEVILGKAGLERAAVLVAALPADADNLYVILAGREANPSLRIVARAQTPRGAERLRRAGADRVVNLEEIGASRLAAYARSPAVAEFLDVVMPGSSVAYRLEEVTIAAGSALDAVDVGDAHIRRSTGASILGLVTPNGEVVTNPTPTTRLTAGTTLVAIGTDDQLAVLNKLACQTDRSRAN